MNRPENSLTVLFAEVSGSARLHEKLDGAEAQRALERCLKRMERVVDANGGRLAKCEGNELMALFTDADQALQAANEMQQKVADLPPVSGVVLTIRLGFSCGTVDENDGEFSGEVLREAAHLARQAAPGQILTSPRGMAALSPELQATLRATGSAGHGRLAAVKLLEVAASEVVIAPAGGEAKRGTDGAAPGRLSLRYGGEVYLIDAHKPVLSLGRDGESDVVIGDRRASRRHATIERRGDGFVIADNSTNGTFVTLTGKPELVLRRGECTARASSALPLRRQARPPIARSSSSSEASQAPGQRPARHGTCSGRLLVSLQEVGHEGLALVNFERFASGVGVAAFHLFLLRELGG